MKTIYLLSLCFIALLPNITNSELNVSDKEDIIGLWQLDMSPNDLNDENFAFMNITQINGSSFEGEFYREGVKIKYGQLNTQLDKIYGALVSGDGSGTYNTTFYYEDGILYGSTHALERNFLSVWIAKKIKP